MLVLYQLYLLHQCLYFINWDYFINACTTCISSEITLSMLVLYQLRLFY